MRKSLEDCLVVVFFCLIKGGIDIAVGKEGEVTELAFFINELKHFVSLVVFVSMEFGYFHVD